MIESHRARSPIWISVVAALSVAALSCKRPKPAEGLELIVEPIDSATSLSGWLAARPHDTSPFAAPSGAQSDNLCATAGAPVPVIGTTMTRYALFYLPERPRDGIIPTDSGRFVREACRLRSIWVIREVDDSLHALVFADSLQQFLVARLGASKAQTDIQSEGAGAWRHVQSWKTGDRWIVLGVESPTRYRSENTGNVTLRRRRVIVVAYTKGSGLEYVAHGDAGPARANRAFEDVHNARVDSIMRLPGVPSVAAELATIVSKVPIHESDEMAPTRSRDDTLDAAIARIMAGTRAAARLLDGPHRAAAFLQADIALTAYEADPATGLEGGRGSVRGVGGGLQDTTATKPRGAGATLLKDASGMTYAGSFLWDAYRADSLGPIGHLAFIELLSKAWFTKPSCQDGPHGFDRVIEHGEAALRRGDTDPLIHFYLAYAYRDIYTLGRGALPDSTERKTFAPRADAARRSALEHFKAAGSAAPVWNDAVRLLIGGDAGLSFYCNSKF